jgi:hypothetical protein
MHSYAAVLIQIGKTGALQTLNSYPSTAGVSQLNGQPIVRNPDDTSDPEFSWSGLDAGVFNAAPGAVQNFDLRFAGGAVLKGKIYNPIAWGPNGEGPEGWVSKLPILGFEWFVYTLRSRVDYLLSVPAQNVRTINAQR